MKTKPSHSLPSTRSFTPSQSQSTICLLRSTKCIGHYFLNYFSNFLAFQYDNVPCLPLSHRCMHMLTDTHTTGRIVKCLNDRGNPPLTLHLTMSLQVGDSILYKVRKSLHLGPVAHKTIIRPWVQKVIFKCHML